MLGRALKASGYARGKYLVATKVNESFLAPGLLREHLEASLTRMQLDYVDLYQLHWHSRAAVKSERYPERVLPAETSLEDTMQELVCNPLPPLPSHTCTHSRARFRGGIG